MDVGLHNIHFWPQGYMADSHTPYTAADVERFRSKVDRSGGAEACWLWLASSMDRYGHGQFTCRFDGKQRHLYAHRVAWELAHGPIPDGLCVCHRCDVAKCVNPFHLFLGTQADNLNDARAKGRLDESRPRACTLTYEDRLDIFRAVPYRGVGVALARQYGVTKAAISKIRRGRFARLVEGAFQAAPTHPHESHGDLQIRHQSFDLVTLSPENGPA